MSIFDENRDLTPEVFRQHKFHESEFKDGWIRTIVNRNIGLVIYLYIIEDNGRYRVTGDSDIKASILKLKEKYIEDSIDLDVLMNCIMGIDFLTLFDYFEL